MTVSSTIPDFCQGIQYLGNNLEQFEQYGQEAVIKPTQKRITSLSDPMAAYQTLLAADALRYLTLQTTATKESGHPGGFASIADTIAALVMLGHKNILTEVGHHAPGFYSNMFLDRSLEDLEVKRREVMLEDVAKLEEMRIRERMLTEQVSHARMLLESGGVSRKQVEDEELALQTAAAERKAIEYAKRREKVELDLAREAYERRHMRSPIDGIVTKILPRVGESVPQNDPILTVVDISRVRFNGTFPAASATKLRAGNVVTIRIQQEGKSLTRQARVNFVSPVADPSSGLVELIAEFDNPDGSVRPGMSGQIVAVAGAL
jgi:biotin carboxyl carrier protein